MTVEMCGQQRPASATLSDEAESREPSSGVTKGISSPASSSLQLVLAGTERSVNTYYSTHKSSDQHQHFACSYGGEGGKYRRRERKDRNLKRNKLLLLGCDKKRNTRAHDCK